MRFIAGDPLRGLAVIGVVVFHAMNDAMNSTGFGERFQGPEGRLAAYGDVLGSLQVSGSFGVWIFFVLSGYLIGRPFVRAAIYRRPLPSISRYAMKRALRILPTYWVVLALVLVFAVWLTGKAEASARTIGALSVLLIHERDPVNLWT